MYVHGARSARERTPIIAAVVVSSAVHCAPAQHAACALRLTNIADAQGNLTGAMAVLKGTPTTYNKDNQEVWELLFSTLDTMNDTVGIATGVLSTLTINPDRMLSGLSADMLATDLAEYLVRKVRAARWRRSAVRWRQRALQLPGVARRVVRARAVHS